METFINISIVGIIDLMEHENIPLKRAVTHSERF